MLLVNNLNTLAGQFTKYHKKMQSVIGHRGCSRSYQREILLITRDCCIVWLRIANLLLLISLHNRLPYDFWKKKFLTEKT